MSLKQISTLNKISETWRLCQNRIATFEYSQLKGKNLMTDIEDYVLTLFSLIHIQGNFKVFLTISQAICKVLCW